MEITKEEFEKELDVLRESAKDKIIVVEGIKDKKALKKLGLENIITLSTPIYKITEIILSHGKPCIILTDLDKKGKQLYSKLNHNLNQFGIKIDNRFRKFLFKTKLRQIEGLTHYLETIPK